MSIERRVMWLEGMFLRPEHFQQQDRHASDALFERSAMAQPFHWGFSRLELDESALKSGRVTIARCSGAFPDGSLFAFPGEIGTLPSLEIPADTTNAVISLVVPATGGTSRIGAQRARDGSAPGTRYIVENQAVTNTLDDSRDSIEIEVGATNARLEIDAGERAGFVSLPVARVREVASDRSVSLDSGFIPTITTVSAAPALSAIVEEIATLLAARADGLSNNLTGMGGAGENVPADFLLLRLTNGKGALFAEMRDARAHHPETIYRASVELAAELSTFISTGSRRAPNFPRYDHDDPAACFGPVLDVIRAALADIGTRRAMEIPLQFSRAGVYFGPITEPEVLESAGRLVIIARAEMEEEEFRTRFPRQVTIGSMDEIRDFIAAADRSVRIRPLGMKPQELPPFGGWMYFEIDKNSSAYSGIEKQRNIAIHCAEQFTDLKLQLWGIKG